MNMSQDYDVVKNFVMSTIERNPGDQSQVLVLKTNGELFNLDVRDNDVFKKSAAIKLNDGIHEAWKPFDSVATMKKFIDEHLVMNEDTKQKSTESTTKTDGEV